MIFTSLCVVVKGGLRREEESKASARSVETATCDPTNRFSGILPVAGKVELSETRKKTPEKIDTTD